MRPANNDIDRLLDEAAIRRVLYQYTRSIDRRDPELLRACYHEDAIDYHGVYSGCRDDYVAWVFGALADFTFTSHNLFNILIDIVGDVAITETYAVAIHGGEPRTDGTKNFLAGFRYLDRFERRKGDWRIAERRVVNDWIEIWNPNRHRLPRFGPVGEAGPNDLLYDLARSMPATSVVHSSTH